MNGQATDFASLKALAGIAPVSVPMPERTVQEAINPFGDIGRDYCDPAGANPHIKLRPLPATPWSGQPTEFIITNNGKEFRGPVWYSHLGLLKMLKHFEFETVLDLGTNDGRCAHVFEAAGKKVTALEPNMCAPILPEYLPPRPAEVQREFIDYTFDKKFDAIWCSHVLEHIRNPGQFLDKIFDDLREGGVLAITVPFNDGNLSATALSFGHVNRYNQWTLLYQLVSSGFDCRNVSFAVYAGMITAIVKKVPNNFHRGSAALVPPPESPLASKDRRLYEPNLEQMFPVPITNCYLDLALMFMNWGNPI